MVSIIFTLLCLLEKRNAFLLPFSIFIFFSATFFLEYQEFRAKKYFTGHRTANIIQLFVAIKGNFSGLFFFLTSRSERERETPEIS